MLSFGIDASRALRIASSSGGFPVGSPPPSRAATMIARVSFEKALPRRESTIAFLCLMLAHLECPDMFFILGVRRARGRAARSRARATRRRGASRSTHRMRAVSASVPSEIFKAYDIRGIYGEQIDGEIAERIGRAFAHVLADLAGKPVTDLRVGLGRDMRLSAP